MNVRMIVKAAKVAVPAIAGIGAVAGTIHFVRKGTPKAKEAIQEFKEDIAAVDELLDLIEANPERAEEKGISYNDDDAVNDYYAATFKLARSVIKAYAPAIVCGAVAVGVGAMGVSMFNRAVLKPRAGAATKAKVREQMYRVLANNKVIVSDCAEKRINDAFVHGSTEPGCVAEKLSHLIVNVCVANGMSADDIAKLLANDTDAWTNLMSKIGCGFELNRPTSGGYDWSNVKHWTDMYVLLRAGDECTFYRPWFRRVANSICNGEGTIDGFETFIKSGVFKMFK